MKKDQTENEESTEPDTQNPGVASIEGQDIDRDDEIDDEEEDEKNKVCLVRECN